MKEEGWGESGHHRQGVAAVGTGAGSTDVALMAFPRP